MNIKLLIMDVDGTLTDGKIYIGTNGEMIKAFNCKDGYGIKVMARSHGIVPVIITGRESDIVKVRSKELGITEVYQCCEDKVKVLDFLCCKYAITCNEIAYIGDDINDLNAMKFCGVRICPANAAMEIQEISTFISKYNGGEGAVRDAIEYIIKEVII